MTHYNDPRIDLFGTLRGHIILEMDEPRKSIALAQLDALAAVFAQAPSADRLREIADLLDLFDRVAELADTVLLGERENYRAVDHTQMQDDLRKWADALSFTPQTDEELSA